MSDATELGVTDEDNMTLIKEMILNGLSCNFSWRRTRHTRRSSRRIRF